MMNHRKFERYFWPGIVTIMLISSLAIWLQGEQAFFFEALNSEQLSEQSE